MLEKRFTHLRENKRAISSLATILIVIIVVVSVVGVALAAIIFGFWHPFGSYVVGSGNLVTKDYDFGDFTIVEVGGGFEVEINQSDSYSISITADDNLFEQRMLFLQFDHIEVSKSGNTLRIGLKLGYTYDFLTLRAIITTPDLQELQLSGGTHGIVGGFSSSHDFVLELSGGSAIVLQGAADSLLIGASGGSQLELSDFQVHDASVSLSGGSRATINLDGRLDADLSGGSHLWYMGEPTMGDIQTSGGSSVQEKLP